MLFRVRFFLPSLFRARTDKLRSIWMNWNVNEASWHIVLSDIPNVLLSVKYLSSQSVVINILVCVHNTSMISVFNTQMFLFIITQLLFISEYFICWLTFSSSMFWCSTLSVKNNGTIARINSSSSFNFFHSFTETIFICTEKRFAYIPVWVHYSWLKWWLGLFFLYCSVKSFRLTLLGLYIIFFPFYIQYIRLTTANKTNVFCYVAYRKRIFSNCCTICYG